MATPPPNPEIPPPQQPELQRFSSHCIPPSTVFLHGTFKGEPAITIPREIEASLAARFENTLIGKFSHGKPSLETIRKFLTIQNFKGTVLVGLIDKKHALLRFQFSEDYVRLFSKSIWNVYGKQMRILKWTSDFRVDREPPIVPIWLSLPMLPIHLVNQSFIFSLVSSFSRPLRIDNATEHLNRPSVARVQVEIDLLELLPSRVWVQSETGTGFWQAIELETALPSYCKYCWHIGHQELFCTIKYPDSQHNHTHPKRPIVHQEYIPKSQQPGDDRPDISTTNRTFVLDPSASTSFSSFEQRKIIHEVGKMQDSRTDVKKNQMQSTSDAMEQTLVTNQVDSATNLEKGHNAPEVLHVTSSTSEQKVADQLFDIADGKSQPYGRQSQIEEEIGKLEAHLHGKDLDASALMGHNEVIVVKPVEHQVCSTQNSDAAASKDQDEGKKNAAKYSSSKCSQGKIGELQAAQTTPSAAALGQSPLQLQAANAEDDLPQSKKDHASKGPQELGRNVVLTNQLAKAAQDSKVGKDSKGLTTKNSFEILSIPEPLDIEGIYSQESNSRNSIQDELKYMSLDPKTQLGEYMSDKEFNEFKEMFTPAKKITRTRKKKQIFDI